MQEVLPRAGQRMGNCREERGEASGATQTISLGTFRCRENRQALDVKNISHTGPTSVPAIHVRTMSHQLALVIDGADETEDQ